MPKLWVVVFGLVLLTIVTRMPALIERHSMDDEGIYSVVANEIVDGGRPYVDAADSKPPLLFWTYAAVFKLAGKYNWFALHAVAVAWTLATMAGLYFVGRRLFDARVGLVAALLYEIFQPWGAPKDLAFNGELLMSLPIAWAYAIALRRPDSAGRPALFGAGALLAVAFLLKQPAAIAALPLGIYFLLPGYRGVCELTKAIARAALFATGFFVTLGLCAVILWKQGILKEAFYWTVGEHAIRHMFWSRAAVNTSAFIGCCLPLVLGSVLSLRRRYGIWEQRRSERTALTMLLLVSILGVMAGSRFFSHYYIQLVLPLALLAAPFYVRLWSGEIVIGWLPPALTYVGLGATVIAFLIAHLMGGNFQAETTPSVQYILEHSSRVDRIFVWGQKPGFYLESQRKPACRFVTTFFLTGYLFGHDVPGLDHRALIQDWAWKDLENDFARHSPAYIIDTQVAAAALYPITGFPILAALLRDHYEKVANTGDAVIYRRRAGF